MVAEKRGECGDDGNDFAGGGDFVVAAVVVCGGGGCGD